jgi:hypothetical protein
MCRRSSPISDAFPVLFLLFSVLCNSGYGGEVHSVSTDQDFVAALVDPTVSTIVVLDDLRFEASTWEHACGAEACHLSRNVTILADPAGPHKASGSEPYSQLLQLAKFCLKPL